MRLFLLVAALAAAWPAAAQQQDVRDVDAGADRAILYSTAETHPKGTFYFSDYEIVFLQIGYAVTDSLQISLTGVPPLVKDQPYFFDLTAKVNLLRSDFFRAAFMVAGDAVVLPKDSKPSSIFGLRLGAIGQICFEATCRTSLVLNVGTLLNDKSNEVVPLYMAASAIVRLTDLVKIMVEPNYAVAVGGGKVEGPTGFLLNYGVRLSGRQFAFDLGFIKPFGADSDEFILGFPLLTFTYRTN